MSYYEDERQRYRPTRERSRRDDYDDDYSTYSARNTKSTSLVKRRDSYDDVDEEITREFSPPGARGGYVRETTIRKSGTRPARSRGYSDDDYDDRGYDRDEVVDRRRTRDYDDRRDRTRDRRRGHSSDYTSRSRSRSRTPPKKERRKSRAEETIESLGLGGLVGGLLGKESKDNSSSKEQRRDRSRARSEGPRSKSSGPSREQVTQAIKAAVLAGAGQAFLSRKEAGSWGGEKGKRVLTAAFSAGGVDGLINYGKDPERHSTRDTIGSAIAGLATSRIVNGSRSKSRGRAGSPDSRRGRSESRHGIRDLAAGGVLAATAKKAYDSVRSRSRGRSQSRAGSASSYGSRSPPRKGSRRRSVSRAAAKGLAALGLTGAAEKLDPDKNSSRGVDRRRDSPDRDDRYRYDDDDDDYYRNEVGQSRSGSTNGRARSVSQSRSDWQVGRSRSAHGYELDWAPHHTGDPDTDSDSDLGSSSGEEKERKQNRRKLIITTGLASIATIHAGHSVYQSYEKRQNRKRAVAEGKISPEQAKKTLNRDRLQEAASVGIAALGLKGAYSEWKEMKEHKEEFDKEATKYQRHHAKREARRKKFDRIERQGYSDSGYASSMPNLSSPPPQGKPVYGSQQFDQPYHNNYGAGGMQYSDANPYAGSFAAPPASHTNGSQYPPPPVGNQYYPPPPG